MKPNWVIYKNDQRIGQAVTWHKAISIIQSQDSLIRFTVMKIASVLFHVEDDLTKQTYKIIKER